MKHSTKVKQMNSKADVLKFLKCVRKKCDKTYHVIILNKKHSMCVCACVCVCVHVCVPVQAITFEYLDIDTSFEVYWYILNTSSLSLSTKVIGSRSRPFYYNELF